MQIKYLLSSFLIATTFGCANMTYNGETTLTNKEFKNLTINGNATLNNVTINEKAHFSSFAKIDNSRFKILISVASVTCTSCTIESLTANNINIEKSTISNIDFKGNEGRIISSNIDSIKNIGLTGKRVLELTDTKVNGNINFESAEQSEVIMKGSSEVKGKIIGAKVTKK
jgi:hypothetical protein